MNVRSHYGLKDVHNDQSKFKSGQKLRAEKEYRWTSSFSYSKGKDEDKVKVEYV